jgi:hypothetical protein
VCCYAAQQSAASQHSKAWCAQPLIQRFAPQLCMQGLRFTQRAASQNSIAKSPKLEFSDQH